MSNLKFKVELYKRLRKSLYVVVCAVLGLATALSCTKSETEPHMLYLGEKDMIPVNLLSGNSSISADEEIKTVRCIIFTDDDKLVNNKLYPVTPGSNPCLVKVDVAIGLNNFYIICNETPELGLALENVTSAAHIKNVRFVPPIDGIGDPVPMYSEKFGVKISRDAAGAPVVIVGGSTSPMLTVTMKRIVAKLGMTVIKNIPSGEVDFSIEKLRYRLFRLPKYSWLAEGRVYPQGNEWGNEIEMEGEGSIRLSSNGEYIISADGGRVPAGVDAIYFPATYIPEHILKSKEDPDYCTYMVIEAECLVGAGSVPMRNVYKLNVGNMPPTNLDIERNVNYQIYATIRGMGATGFYAEIVPVDEYDLPITWKPFEGYAIVGEREIDYGNDLNIWNSYSQYSGILKIVKNKVYSNACFRYGSVVALSSVATATEFNPASDVLWMPDATKTSSPISSWDKVAYLTSGDVLGTNHSLENIKLGKGDPCRLVGLTESEISSGKIDNELWRLPTMSEMQWLETARNYTTDARGFYSFSHLLTPFNGYRSETGQMVPATATSGHYWSSTGAGSFVFGQNNTVTLATDDPRKAYAVRCIRTSIPESVFHTNGIIATYDGGVHNVPVSGQILTPHWRMELGNSADAPHISLDKNEGASSVVNKVTIQPLANPYQVETYTLKVSGYGLDGRVHQSTVAIEQTAVSHQVTISWTSTPELVFSDGYYRIPKQGATIDFRMHITPEPFAAYYPTFDQLKWCATCDYSSDVANTLRGTFATRNEVSTIKIEPNTYGHTLGLQFGMIPESSHIYPPHHYNGIVILIQNKD